MNTSILVTFFIFLMILLILISLGSGLYYLVKDQGRSKRTVRALLVRIILSLLLFFALLLAFALGWIAPHNLFGVSP